jgi:hypothetical protein
LPIIFIDNITSLYEEVLLLHLVGDYISRGSISFYNGCVDLYLWHDFVPIDERTFGSALYLLPGVGLGGGSQKGILSD